MERAPLPIAADRSTAPYYVIIRPGHDHRGQRVTTVYVKEGGFFREQGGLRSSWGANWAGIVADSIDDARLKCHASEGTTCPAWHLSGR